MQQQWHYMIDGRPHGPVSSQQLIQLASSGRLQPSDLVWIEGMKPCKAAEWKGLFQKHTTGPPPVPPPWRCLCCGDDTQSAAAAGIDRRLGRDNVFGLSDADLCPACFWEKVTGKPPPPDLLPPGPPPGRYGPYKDDTSPGWDNMIKGLEDGG